MPNNGSMDVGAKSPTVTGQRAVLLESMNVQAGYDDRNGSVAAAAACRPRLSPREMESLTALCDTFLPSLQLPPYPAADVDDPLRTFYHTSASMMGTPEAAGEYISGRMRHAMRGPLRLALWLLSTWYGTLILCGTKSLSRHFPYFHSLSQLSPQRREEIVRSWSFSSISLLRQLFRGLKFMVLLFYFTTVDEKKVNPTWQALGYCGPDPEHVSQVQPLTQDGQDDEEKGHRPVGPLRHSLVFMDSSRETISSALNRAGLCLAATRDKKQKPLLTIHCDAVVVGSGSGGGVVAGVLAKAGYKVIVLDKGHYHARTNLTLLEGQAMSEMYEDGGLLATSDTGVVVLSGSTVGGGSAINWSASIRTPDHVASEWVRDHGLDLFGSDAYAQALDVVCDRMGVQPDFEVESLNNSVLRRGCSELGYPVTNIPRNAPPDHYCGWCCFGCRDGRKKGTAETWLVDMAESGNGVVLPGCTALRVLREDRGRRRNVAAGVEFEYESRSSGGKERCVIKSKATVVACGAIGTPVLLRRSGLKNANIGRHLHLHPVVMVWGYFPQKEHEKKSSYEGGIMTAMSTVVSNWESGGYGAVIQTPSLHPGMFSALTPWVSGGDFKDRMARFERTAHIFALARDKGSGWVDWETGSIGYAMEASDEESLKSGVEKMLRIMAAAGAVEMGTQHARGKRVDVKRASWHEVEAFVKRERRRGVRDLRTPVCSAHQMGSCRMGVHPRTSAVDPRGETWEVEGLFVADTSVFPTALGVNPMVTVQAIAYCTAHSVVEMLRRKMRRPISDKLSASHPHNQYSRDAEWGTN